MIWIRNGQIKTGEEEEMDLRVQLGMRWTSWDKGGAILGEQKCKSNALGLECGLVRHVEVPFFRIKRSSLSIMSTKVLPAESTLPQPQSYRTGSSVKYIPRLTKHCIRETPFAVTSARQREAQPLRMDSRQWSHPPSFYSQGAVFLTSDRNLPEPQYNRESLLKTNWKGHLALDQDDGCGIQEGEGNAIPPDSLYAAIYNVFDIGRLQDFSKRHHVEHTTSRRGSFDPLAMNDKWASDIVVASEIVTNEASEGGDNKKGRRSEVGAYHQAGRPSWTRSLFRRK
ncbi:hypothetical protein EVAR_19920_1 [Eumeta japonica]|uniref:Uncharacterized protein n=1 Tax=Eumeta variegata TaxID=151549 RepID=A0A4C1ZLH0_EUMVA|nr:hypothetical protein EVAR_19920_1 [Eumeta japonica]